MEVRAILDHHAHINQPIERLVTGGLTFLKLAWVGTTVGPVGGAGGNAFGVDRAVLAKGVTLHMIAAELVVLVVH